MTILWTIIMALLAAVVYLWSQLRKIKKRMKGSIYIKRAGELVFLEDGEGNTISEKIIINQ